MNRGFKLFLVGLLAFCVLFGAFCIIYPLVWGEDIRPLNTAPKTETTPKEPATVQPPKESVAQPDEPAQPTMSITLEQEAAQALLETMSLQEKVYQLFMVKPEALTGVPTATRAGDATKTAIAEQPVGGIIYFAKNLEDRDQTIEMIEKSQSYAKIPMLIGVDEEGGIVSRVGSNPKMGTTKFDNMSVYGAKEDPQGVYSMSTVMGKELKELGFNVDFAPVADVVTNPENTEIGPRSFSSDPVTAAQMVGSFVAGMQDTGLPATLKHFPGHGGTTTDTHNGLSTTTRTLAEMRTSEFVPFRAGIDAGAEFVMVGHLSVAALHGGANIPSDLSPQVVTDLLRRELGFEGIIITDSHEMGAITNYFKADEAAVKALVAGVDIVLMPADLNAAVQGVLDAIDGGTLTEARIDESVLRVLTMKYRYGIIK